MPRIPMPPFMPEHRDLVARHFQWRLDHPQRAVVAYQPFRKHATRSVLARADNMNKKCGTDSTTRRVMPAFASASSVAPANPPPSGDTITCSSLQNCASVGRRFRRG
jgi:hypothetical protein